MNPLFLISSDKTTSSVANASALHDVVIVFIEIPLKVDGVTDTQFFK